MKLRIPSLLLLFAVAGAAKRVRFQYLFGGCVVPGELPEGEDYFPASGLSLSECDVSDPPPRAS